MSPKGSHDSNWDMGWIAGGIMFQFLAGMREFCLLQNVHTKSGGPRSLLFNDYWGLFLWQAGGGQPGVEVDYSHQVPRLRLRKAIAALPHLLSSYVLGQIYCKTNLIL